MATGGVWGGDGSGRCLGRRRQREVSGEATVAGGVWGGDGSGRCACKLARERRVTRVTRPVRERCARECTLREGTRAGGVYHQPVLAPEDARLVLWQRGRLAHDRDEADRQPPPAREEARGRRAELGVHVVVLLEELPLGLVVLARVAVLGVVLALARHQHRLAHNDLHPRRREERGGCRRHGGQQLR